MRTLLSAVFAMALMSGLSGCASVTASMGGNTTDTGEAWWVKSVGMGPMVFSAKLFYCPAPANGPAQCKEAKIIDTAK